MCAAARGKPRTAALSPCLLGARRSSCVPNYCCCLRVHARLVLQPLDKMEQAEIQKQAEKFVEPGFKLVTQTKVGLTDLNGYKRC